MQEFSLNLRAVPADSHPGLTGWLMMVSLGDDKAGCERLWGNYVTTQDEEYATAALILDDALQAVVRHLRSFSPGDQGTLI